MLADIEDERLVWVQVVLRRGARSIRIYQEADAQGSCPGCDVVSEKG